LALGAPLQVLAERQHKTDDCGGVDLPPSRRQVDRQGVQDLDLDALADQRVRPWSTDQTLTAPLMAPRGTDSLVSR
jgi:hypothetical protein